MITSAEPATGRAVGEGGRSRRVADKLSLVRVVVVLMAVLGLPSPSHGVTCKCNETSVLSDCRWNRYTCIISESLGECYARTRIAESGSVIVEYGCLLTLYNPQICSGALNTHLAAYKCCSNQDFCNAALTPTLNPPTRSSQALGPSPSPLSAMIAPMAASVFSPETAKPVEPSVQPVSSVTTSGNWVVVRTEPVPSPSPPSLPPPPTGRLMCECSRSLFCPEASCLTNYKCFRKVRYVETSDYFETQLGCIESIAQVNLEVVGVCNGTLDSLDYKIRCCDHKDMCNRELDVRLGPQDPTQDTPTGSPQEPSPSEEPSVDGVSGSKDQMFLILSIVVVMVTMVVTIAVIFTVVALFCLRYQRDKTQVTSVDQFTPPGLKQLSNSSITCTIIQSHPAKTDQTEIIHYV